MLKYRGSGATASLEHRRRHDGILIKLPDNASAEHIHVVDKCKHLGSIARLDNTDVYEVQHRCSEALRAYSPIASKICGSACIGAWLKIHFVKSLVLPTLCFVSTL